MNARMRLVAIAAMIAGCATPPPPPLPDEIQELLTRPAAPMVEYPPVEPVESEAPPVAPGPAPPPAGPAPTPVEAPIQPPPPAVTPAISAEALELQGLLADLQRYGTLPPDDLRREVGAATQTLARQRTDANRIRLAVLYTLARSSPQDDQRALQLLDNVAKGNPGSPAMKQLAAVVQIQVTERLRAVRDEQQKADIALQKLEALRAIDRQLLRDRFGGGGGGGGGGGAGSGSGGH